MSKVDDLQRRFEGAMASLPASPPPSPIGLHSRLRKRRMRIRVAGLTGIAFIAATGLTVGVTNSSDAPAAAVTLRVATSARLSGRELQADATIMRKRLADFGDHHAQVAVSGHSIVVTGGPAQLANPSSALTASPALLVRPVLCLSGPYNEIPGNSSESLLAACVDTPYALQPVTPPTFEAGVDDPALAGFPSTAPSLDAANTAGVALLPVAGSNSGRDLVGPTQLALSAQVATAEAVQDATGNWLVQIQLTPSASAQWDQVAYNNFHKMLGVDLDGQIVTAPLIEPGQTSYTPFGGKMELSGFQSQGEADAVAAALQSGPLPIPLQVG